MSSTIGEMVRTISGVRVMKSRTARVMTKPPREFVTEGFLPNAYAIDVPSRKIATPQRPAEAVAYCDSNLPARSGQTDHNTNRVPKAKTPRLRSREFADITANRIASRIRLPTPKINSCGNPARSNTNGVRAAF